MSRSSCGSWPSRPAPSRRERGVDRLGRRAGQCHDAAADGARAAVLRLPDRGGAAGVQPGRPGPLHAREAAVRWPSAWPGAPADQAAVDPRPSSSGWTLLEVAAGEPIRNRVMLALAYDAALRREELCSLRTDDLDPARRMLRVRAETTKNRLERVVPYSAPTGVLLSGYLAHRATISRARGPLFLSESRRNRGAAADAVDLVEGRPADRAGRGPAAVLHPHHPAPVPDRPGPDGLGTARDRHIRRSPHAPTRRCTISTCPAGTWPTSSTGAWSRSTAGGCRCWPRLGEPTAAVQRVSAPFRRPPAGGRRTGLVLAGRSRPLRPLRRADRGRAGRAAPARAGTCARRRWLRPRRRAVARSSPAAAAAGRRAGQRCGARIPVTTAARSATPSGLMLLRCAELRHDRSGPGRPTTGRA